MSDHRPTAGDPGAEGVAEGADGRTFDPERTIGGDADLLAEVRSAVEAARRGLAAPPPDGNGWAPPATAAPAADATRMMPNISAGDVTRVMPTTSPDDATRVMPTTAAGDVTRALPATAAVGEPGRTTPPAPPMVAAVPVTPSGAAAPTEVLPAQPGAAVAAQRWVPPPRLKPAATPAPAVFLHEPAAERNRTWWIVGAAAAAVAVAAAIGIAVAVTGGGSTPSDDSTPVSGSAPVTTVAGSTTVTPTSARPTTSAVTTTVPPTTTAAPTTTVSPTTAAASPAAPTTAAPPDTAPPPPAETVPAAPGG